MKKFVLIVILVSLFFSLNAENKKYSLKKAIAASLIFPGGGELYVKKYKTAGFFISSELTVLFSYIRLKNQVEYETNTYKQFAYAKAGIPKKSDKTKYTLASKWMSSEDYNNYIKMNGRNYFVIYLGDQQAYEEYLAKNLIPEDEGWDWHNSKNWQKYRKYRTNTQNYKIYANLIASGFVINRLISMIDSIISVKKLNGLKISAMPNLQEKGIKIGYTYKF